MEVGLDNQNRIKEAFSNFFDPSNGEQGYGKAVQQLIESGKSRLIVDISALRRFKPDVARHVNPEYLSDFTVYILYLHHLDLCR